VFHQGIYIQRSRIRSAARSPKNYRLQFPDFLLYAPNKLDTTPKPAIITTALIIRPVCFPPAAAPPVNCIILAVGLGVSVGLTTITVPLLGAATGTGQDEGTVEQLVVVVFVIVIVVAVAGAVVPEVLVEAAALLLVVEDKDVGEGRVIVTPKLRAH
jgi:hypothetical protein